MSETEIHGLERTTLSLVLPLYGGTMRGPLNLFRETPINSLEAASKAYVDKKSAEGGGGVSPWVDLELATDIFEQLIPLQSRTIAGGHLCEVRGKIFFPNAVNIADFQLGSILSAEMWPVVNILHPLYMNYQYPIGSPNFSPVLIVLVISVDGAVWMKPSVIPNSIGTIQPATEASISCCYGTAL